MRAVRDLRSTEPKSKGPEQTAIGQKKWAEESAHFLSGESRPCVIRSPQPAGHAPGLSRTPGRRSDLHASIVRTALPRTPETAWDFSPANACSSRASSTTARSPTASPGLPPRRRRTGFQLPGRALQGPHHRVRRRIRLDAVFDCDVGSDEQIERPVRRPRPGLARRLRRLRALDRLRAARGDRRRVPGRPVARGLPHRPRHLGLQLPGDGQGRAAAARERAACSRSPTWARVRAVPDYNTMGLAKASLEASVRYLAATWGPRASASTASRPARSRRWRPRASRASASCCGVVDRTRRCAATSRSTTSATRPRSCCPTSPAA